MFSVMMTASMKKWNEGCRSRPSMLLILLVASVSVGELADLKLRAHRLPGSRDECVVCSAFEDAPGWVREGRGRGRWLKHGEVLCLRGGEPGWAHDNYEESDNMAVDAHVSMCERERPTLACIFIHPQKIDIPISTHPHTSACVGVRFVYSSAREH